MATSSKWYTKIDSPASNIRFDHFPALMGKRYEDILKKLNLFQTRLKLSSTLKKNTTGARINKDIFYADAKTYESINQVIIAKGIDIKYLNDLTWLVTGFQHNFIHSFINAPIKKNRRKYESDLLQILKELKNGSQFDISKIQLNYPFEEITNPLLLNIISEILKKELPKFWDEELKISSLTFTKPELDFAIDIIRFFIANKVIEVDLNNLKRDTIRKSNFVLIQELIECSLIPFIETPEDHKKFLVYIKKDKSVYWDAILKAFKRHFDKDADITTLVHTPGWSV